MQDGTATKDQCETQDQRLEEVKTMLAAGHALLGVQMFENLFAAFVKVVHVAGGNEEPGPRPMAMLETDPEAVLADIVNRTADAELPLDADFPEALTEAVRARSYIVHESVISQVPHGTAQAESFEAIRDKLLKSGSAINRCIESMNRTIELMHAASRGS